MTDISDLLGDVPMHPVGNDLPDLIRDGIVVPGLLFRSGCLDIWTGPSRDELLRTAVDLCDAVQVTSIWRGVPVVPGRALIFTDLRSPLSRELLMACRAAAREGRQTVRLEGLPAGLPYPSSDAEVAAMLSCAPALDEMLRTVRDAQASLVVIDGGREIFEAPGVEPAEAVRLVVERLDYVRGLASAGDCAVVLLFPDAETDEPLDDEIYRHADPCTIEQAHKSAANAAAERAAGVGWWGTPPKPRAQGLLQ